jgi:SpoVK/Ycf46/Vps4 family AAA+-type ATPase
MANPLRDFLFGTVQPKKDLVEALTPRRTFNDVIVPPSTRRALDHALIQIKKHDLIFHQWGLAERHNAGLGLAFNFAGPPGTGKTICAEAIAHALEKRLLLVRYSEMESLWAGETGKNVTAVFRAASEQDAVLFFDEADAIAGRRFASVTQGYQREANTVVNVLLKELEEFSGVVIFATNLAANFDPAFERRIRTHILFEMPDAETREKIWKVQLHARKTPLANDVDFRVLAERFDNVSGGDIKNAVLKAAQMATAEPGPDHEKSIHQHHFVTGMEDVLASKRVMDQSIFNDPSAMGDGSHAMSAMTGLNGAWSQLSRNQESLEDDVNTLAQRMGESERRIAALPGIVERFDDATQTAQLQLRSEITQQLDELAGSLNEYSANLVQVREGYAQMREDYAKVAPRFEAVEHEQRDLGTRMGGIMSELKDSFATLEERLNTRLVAVEQGLVQSRETMNTLAEQEKQRWRLALIASLATVAILAGVLIVALLRR